MVLSAGRKPRNAVSDSNEGIIPVTTRSSDKATLLQGERVGEQAGKPSKQEASDLPSATPWFSWGLLPEGATNNHQVGLPTSIKTIRIFFFLGEAPYSRDSNL